MKNPFKYIVRVSLIENGQWCLKARVLTTEQDILEKADDIRSGVKTYTLEPLPWLVAVAIVYIIIRGIGS